MDTDLVAFHELWNKIYRSDEPAEIVAVLDSIDEQERTGMLDADHARSLRTGVLRALKDLTIDDPDTALSLIVTYALPLCLAESDDLAAYTASQCQTVLAEWIGQYVGTSKTALRDQVLDSLINMIRSGYHIASTCSTLTVIGYRRSDVPAVLWSVVSSRSVENGNVALASLAALGVPTTDRERVVEEARRRASAHATEPLDLSLIVVFDRLAEPALLPIVQDWLDHGYPLSEPDTYLAQVCAGIASTRDADEDLQDQAWHIARTLDERSPYPIFGGVELSSSITSHCDSRAVVPYLLQRWGAHNTLLDQQYRVGLRISECVRPRHLDSSLYSAAGDALNSVRAVARTNTGTEGRGATLEMRVKEISWNVLLRFGDPETLALFTLALEDEENSFTRRAICLLLACFRVDPLPSIVHLWLIQPFDHDRAGASVEWAYRIAAVDAAHSSGTRRALNDLLECGYTMSGLASQQSGDAVADLARSFAQAGDQTLVPSLASRLVRADAHPAQTMLAAVGLDAVAEIAPDLIDETVQREIVAIVHDDERDRYERSLLLTTLIHSRQGTADAETTALCRRWADEKDDWLALRALETLAESGELLLHPDLMRRRLGLEQQGDVWQRVEGTAVSEWAPTVIGALYRRNPAAFVDALASIIRTEQWASAIQALHQIQAAHDGSGGLETPPEIIDALVFRARTRQRSRAGETALFASLATLDPIRLAAEPWEEILAEWLPEVCIALAEALEKLPPHVPLEGHVETILLDLARDGAFAVRRAAYRALAHRSSETLMLACASWLEESSAPVLRQRAAEACSWYPEDAVGEEAFRTIHETLEADPELSVRDSARRTANERRERGWASTYLSRVLTVADGTHAEMLDAWKYGQALTALGDDEAIRTLNKRRMTPTLPPHVRYWLSTLQEAVQARWKKVMQDWPDPWLAFDGALYQGTGTLRLQDGTEHPVAYSMWAQPIATPPDVERWGGALTDLPMGVHGQKDATLRTNDGIDRPIVLAGTTQHIRTGYPMESLAHFFGRDRFQWSDGG